MGIILPVNSQVTSDGTTSTTVNINNNNFTILNGIQKGNNLFHSFKEFSIPTGSSATFQNSSAIENIINRVTGGNVSNIDGLIKANDSASVFLINPSGIVFGENARLDIGGSFLGTTAESILFEDGFNYSAIDSEQTPLLTISVPLGLQMGSNPGKIEVNGSGHQIIFDIPTLSFIRDARSVGLQVPSGKTLSLIGGNISLQGGNLTAQEGRVELGSVAESAIVELITTDNGFTTEYNDITNFGNINLSQAASVEVSGEGGGNIQLQGRNISLIEDSAIIADTLGAENGKLFTVKASESVEIIGRNLPIFPTGFSNQVAPGATGNGGNTTIETPKLTVSGASLIQANTLGIGDGGNLKIDTEYLSILDGGQISSAASSMGNSGILTVQASEAIEIKGTLGDFISSGLFTSVARQGTGNGGNLRIETNLLRVVEGGKIAANTVAVGNGGNIHIEATDVEVSDAFINFEGAISGLVVTVEPNSTGNGGNLVLNADNLRISNGGQVTASTLGAGDAGNITLNVNNIEVTGISEDGQFVSSISAFSETDFAAGSININANNLNVRHGAQINVSTFDTGDGGNLNVNADTISLDNQGSLQANVAAGEQGNINLNSQLLLLRRNSNITTDATGTANGGNITINSPIIAGFKNSDIIANAVEGNGGNINIKTKGIFGLEFSDRLTAESDITASSEFGLSGQVMLQQLDFNPVTSLVKLPSKFKNNAQIQAGCKPFAENQFVVLGRDALPQQPSDLFNGSNVLVTLLDLIDEGKIPYNTSPQNNNVNYDNQKKVIVEATGFMRNENGEIELVALENIPLKNKQFSECSGLYT
ncbi:MAG: filamentous hemagglutinin N-terminal domain-containing protein [Cyanobacteria bacterium J06633_8]